MNEGILCYPIGGIEKRDNFVDIVDEKWNIICTVISLRSDELSEDEKKITQECIIWDEDNVPDIYITHWITVDEVKRALIMLEQHTGKKYKLINKNIVDTV